MSIYRSWIESPIEPETFPNHWKKFEQIRQKHNDNIHSETNKLVLRLDELINSDNLKNVEWTPDSLVKLCPFCAKSFTLVRRRHHCRACGAILCSNCSRFLEYKSACKLVKPAKLYTDAYDRIEDIIENRGHEEMPKIRTCQDCMRLLDKRVQVIEDHYSQPTFYDVYLTLRQIMEQADKLILTQASLISEGRAVPEELKSKIQDLKQEVISVSAKLAKMSQRAGSGRQAHLLSSINESVAFWVKEGVEAKTRRTLGYHQPSRASIIGDQHLQGWVPQQTNSPAAPDEDPLLIQIKNLNEYIKQAKLADRFEEVSILEESKRDLEIEYLNQSVARDNNQEAGACSPPPLEEGES